ncbi:hypothetical protein OIU79_013869 [Salix purpurea]|uniref:Uncharacterized protein n=1 Tax=Salix purpurea TaxID=77065 RepID=A0A9Q0PPN2_SALPP|nr:hypothetical protein OIU79_013869 [Salix purpurea]
MVVYLDGFRFFCGISICGSDIEASSIIGQPYHLCHSKRQLLLLLGPLDTMRLPSSNESLSEQVSRDLYFNFSALVFI